jgi:hypothetical protein
MAREAGSQEYGPLTRNWSFELTQLKAFEALVRADERSVEREALLDLVDAYAKNNTDLKAAIRARGNT